MAGVVHTLHAFPGSPLREILEKDDCGIALVPSSQGLRHVILLEMNRKKKKEEGDAVAFQRCCFFFLLVSAVLFLLSS